MVRITQTFIVVVSIEGRLIATQATVESLVIVLADTGSKLDCMAVAEDLVRPWMKGSQTMPGDHCWRCG